MCVCLDLLVIPAWLLRGNKKVKGEEGGVMRRERAREVRWGGESDRTERLF